jgi:pimeloyl-ACP methyl ester carboxylesterase
VAEPSGDGPSLAVAWRTGGSGPPLLLVNGYAATSEDWDPSFVAALEETFEVIRPDNRGTGRSPLGDPAALSIGAMAADLVALLDALGIDRACVAGWSMGGFVAQELARRAPDRVAGLALLSTDPGGPGAVLADPADWARLTDRSGTAREQAARVIALLFPPDLAPAVDRRFGDAVAAARAGLSPAALAAQEAAIAAWHAEPPPPAGPAPPAVIVHGDRDVLIPPRNAGPLAARWRGARVARIAGAAHAVMAQEPRRVADLIGRLARG